MKDVRAESLPSVEAWVLKADSVNKKRFYKFFDSGPEGVSRGSAGGSSRDEKPVSLSSLEEAEKELELRNWATSYGTTNNSLGHAIDDVKRRAQGDKGRTLEPLASEILKPSVKNELMSQLSTMSENELNDIVRLMRSLSIAYEQDRNAFSSEYIIEYEPKHIPRSGKAKVDHRASSLSGPITYAPPKAAHTKLPTVEPTRNPTPQMVKPAPRPVSEKALLAWAGGNEAANSSYRTQFQKPSENYPHVVPAVDKVSFACNRTMPDHLVSDKHRTAMVFLPCELESRHRMKQKRPTAQPSWHLLYKQGITYTDKPGKHDPGELSIYMKDYNVEKTSVLPSKPTLDPFASNITIGMSDYPYHTTTYQSTIERSATMEYDRRLV